jgi:hypothetical protein
MSALVAEDKVNCYVGLCKDWDRNLWMWLGNWSLGCNLPVDVVRLWCQNPVSQMLEGIDQTLVGRQASLADGAV